MQGAVFDPETTKYFYGRSGAGRALVENTRVNGIVNAEIFRVDSNQATPNQWTKIAQGEAIIPAGGALQFNNCFTDDFTEYRLICDIVNGDTNRSLALQYHPVGSTVYKTTAADYESFYWETRGNIKTDITYSIANGPAFIHSAFQNQPAGTIGFMEYTFGDMLSANSSFVDGYGAAWKPGEDLITVPTPPVDNITRAETWGNSSSGAFSGFAAAGFRIIENGGESAGVSDLKITYRLGGRV